MTESYLESNSFSGSIPSNIDDLMPRLRCLDLSENNLNGTIPLSIQKINDLGGLYLRSNKLSGGLPIIGMSHNYCGLWIFHTTTYLEKFRVQWIS